jgi:predicted phosphate transport protein (TIGR00153 family)
LALKKDMDYFEMFVKGTEYGLKAAKLLEQMLKEGRPTEERIAEIKKVEQDADNHLHIMTDQLNHAFITPIDRDDILKIAKETDDISDSIDSVSNKMWMMHVTRVTPPMLQMAAYVVSACEMLVKVMSEIRNHKKSNKLSEYVVEINRVEEMGDKCYKEAMYELFETEKDPIELIRMKEIYRELEAALDDCEDVADLVEGIIITKT